VDEPDYNYEPDHQCGDQRTQPGYDRGFAGAANGNAVGDE